MASATIEVIRSISGYRALGTTDYYSVGICQTVLAKKKEGWQRSVELIVPNVGRKKTVISIFEVSPSASFPLDYFEAG